MAGKEKSSTRQRTTPKLKEMKVVNKNTLDIIEESTEERMRRIESTKVSLFAFFSQCVDYRMLKIFCSLLLFLLTSVVVATLVYLGAVYVWHGDTWTYYFPPTLAGKGVDNREDDTSVSYEL